MKSKDFHANEDVLPEILNYVRLCLAQTELSQKQKMHVELALEEAVVNVIHYSKAKSFTLTPRMEKTQVEFELIDSGVPFNPLEKPAPKPKTALNEIEPGGVGILLMRGLMDALLYRREGDQNILTLVKKI